MDYYIGTLSSSKATAASLGDVSSHVDIETLVDYIPEMASQWMFLGTKLGQNKLVKSLKKREANDNEKCYEILENWIEGEENPSLEKFLIAMESPAVNLIGLSKKIKKVGQIEIINNYTRFVKNRKPTEIINSLICLDMKDVLFYYKICM